MKLPTLYKMTNTGKIQQWDIETHWDDEGDFFEVIHGQQDGKMQASKTYVKKGKNTGKANETTPKQQCELEAKSKWKKKRDRGGYTENVPESKPLLPMLAKNYTKDGKHIKMPCIGQPKLDGIRCLVHIKDGKVKLVSRRNKEFKCLQHLESQFLTNVDTVLDGELYSDEITFQEITSAVKRDDANDLTSKIKITLYDMISDEDYEYRHASLKKYENEYVKVIECVTLRYAEHIENQFERFTSQGYEGLMLRNFKGPYKINGRSKDLQKYKKFQDAEFKIIDIVEGKGKFSGMGIWQCTSDKGDFKVTPKGTEELKREYWKNKNKYIGKMATVEFFEMTDGGIPRFPIGVGIRDYEN